MKLNRWALLLMAAFAASSAGSIVPVPCDDPAPFTAWEKAQVASSG
ncbi:MAG: hypothetical protein RLZZ366_2211, partial [Pseudomonadota bacterium]